jgi:hypothetical protein
LDRKLGAGHFLDLICKSSAIFSSSENASIWRQEFFNSLRDQKLAINQGVDPIYISGNLGNRISINPPEFLDISAAGLSKMSGTLSLGGITQSGRQVETLARGLELTSAGLTVLDDLSGGHGILYSSGHALISWAGAAIGAAACGGLEDGIALVCAAIGAFIGGSTGAAVWRGLFG